MLEIKNLNYSYDDQKSIVSNLSLKLNANSFNSIIGSNGSGKSTLCKLIANVLRADSGEILLDNKAIDSKDVAIVFQNPSDQFVRPIVYNDLAFGLENLNIAVDEIDRQITDFAHLFNITHLLDRTISSLSGGEKQRVAIISNLMLNPKVLIMDEATDMLDPLTRIALLERVKRHAIANQMIVIYITHDMELAFSTDNIVVIKDGSVETCGAPNLVFNNQKVILDNRLEVPYSIKLMKQICGEYCYTNLLSFKESYELDLK